MFGGKGKGRKRNSKRPRTRSSGVCCVCVVLLFGVCVGSRPSRPASSNDKSCFRSCSLSFSSQSNRRRRMTTVGFASCFMHARRGRNGIGKVLHSIAYSIVSVKRPLLPSFLLVPHPRTHDGADRAPKTHGLKRKGDTRPPSFPWPCPALSSFGARLVLFFLVVFISSSSISFRFSPLSLARSLSRPS